MAKEVVASVVYKIFCIEEAGIGIRPQNVKKSEHRVKKYMENVKIMYIWVVSHFKDL